MLAISMVADIRYHGNANGPQARDDFPRFGEAAHMGWPAQNRMLPLMCQPRAKFGFKASA